MLGRLFAKKNEAEPVLPEDQVKLKPILGIRPGVYLVIAAAFILALALFFILFYPGISRPGSVVVFSSDPSGSALRVDDIYAGTSPCKIFVPKGKHAIEVILPGFEAQRIECTIPSRLFASALFPRKYPLDVQLKTDRPASDILAIAAAEYAAWSFAGEPTANWQIPMVLSEGVYRAGMAAGAGDETGDLIATAARFAITRAALRDLVRAHTLSANGGNAASPLTLIRSAAQAAAFLSRNDGGAGAASAAWLADTLPVESAAVLISSPWYQNQLASFAGITAGELLSGEEPDPASQAALRPPPRFLPAEQIRVGGLLFTGFKRGILAQGEPFPHQVPIDDFLICSTEVPTPAYADFLDAVPQWRQDKQETLEEQGLVDSQYLADFGTDVPIMGNRITGISSVSWFAAQAFCEWLTTKLPPAFAGWEVRLPTEAEWEYAVKSAQRQSNRVFTLENGSWEWCGDPYAHLPFISAPAYAINAVGSPERSVRGGSWVNMAGSVGVETRGALPPETCSAFVSFRPVIAPRLSPADASR